MFLLALTKHSSVTSSIRLSPDIVLNLVIPARPKKQKHFTLKGKMKTNLYLK